MMVRSPDSDHTVEDVAPVRQLRQCEAAIVGAVLSLVDAELGNALRHTDLNRSVVEKVALKIMRERGVRAHDISLHIGHVVECISLRGKISAKQGGCAAKCATGRLEL